MLFFKDTYNGKKLCGRKFLVGKSNLKAEGTLGFKMDAPRFKHLLGVDKKLV